MSTGARLPPLVMLGAGLFIAAIVAITANLWHRTQQDALDAAAATTSRLMASAETEINRSLLGVDLLLAGGAELLTPALNARGELDAAQASLLLSGAVSRTLLARDLLLLDPGGHTLASALRASGGSDRPSLPQDFVEQVLDQAAPQMLASSPRVQVTASKPSLYFARPLNLPGGRQLVIAAEVAVGQLSAVLDRDAGNARVVLTLERDNGELLVRSPANGAPAGVMLQPPLRTDTANGEARVATMRDGAQAAMLASRPTLYRQLLLSISLPLDIALQDARATQRALLWAAAGLILMVLAAATGLLWHLSAAARARAALDRARATLDQALFAMADGFLLCDAQRRVVAWNPRYLELMPWLKPHLALGVSYERLTELASEQLYPHGPDSQRLAWRERRLAAHRRADGSFEQAYPSGVVIQAIERPTPDGGVVGVLRDITRSDQVLSRAKADAEAANEAKSRFLAQMSHEIRTPLNAVLGTNGLLLAGNLTPEQRHLCELMRSSGQMLLALINDILDLSKIEAGQMTLEIVAFDPVATVRDVVSLLAVRAQARGLDLQLALSEPVAHRLMGDPSRLRQILFNLVGNAVKFTEQGRIQVRLSQQSVSAHDVRLLIDVADTGVGIPAEQLPRLFDRFVQGDNSIARRYGGSGLGLAISHDLVALMGGDIQVRSRLGVGSTFSVSLPAGVAPAEALPRVDSAPAEAPGASPRRRILVAEDNGVNQILIKAMLDHLGHYCDIVADGLEAVRQVQAAHYDLVLMDLQMPGMDGETATREIRLLPGALAHIPIVAMTAHALPGDRQTLLDAGMTEHLTKPVDLGVLADMINRISR
jgi:signal transduction histidine kinase